MRLLPQSVTGFVIWVRRFVRAGLGELGRWRTVLALVAVAAAVVMLTPWSWWRTGGRLLAGPGWRWVPILLLVAGLVVLAQVATGRRSHSGSARRRPVAIRTPLFVHVAVLVLIAATVAVAAGMGMWWAFGRPPLGAAPPAGTTPGGAGAAAWTVQNTFDAMKIVLSVVAGIGGVVALTVAYRKQGHSEAAEHREDTKLFNDRFGKASDQLGSDKAAVRLAGVYALAGLADDWAEGRQTCIDVLCAYLRMPYTPPLSSTADFDRDARQEQQVRHTVVNLICEHLQPDGPDERERWHGHRFHLRGAVLDGGSLQGIHVTADTDIDCAEAHFPAGMDFLGAAFLGGVADFRGAVFSGGRVDFTSTVFVRSWVEFGGAVFSGGMVDFRSAAFSGGRVDFRDAAFSGGVVDFSGARFRGGVVDLTHPREWVTPPVGVSGSEPGVRWPSDECDDDILG